MEFSEVLSRRKSTRRFSPEQITPQQLETLLAAANASPVGSALFGDIHLTVVTDREVLLTLGRTVWQRDHPRSKKKTVSSFQTVTDYIAAHLEGDLSLDALSRELYLSKFHIAHLVQDNTGLSLHRYVTKKRLSACCEAIRGGESIGACCARLGFANYSSFYRAFLKEYGVSPSAFLRERVPAAEERS